MEKFFRRCGNTTDAAAAAALGRLDLDREPVLGETLEVIGLALLTLRGGLGGFGPYRVDAAVDVLVATASMASFLLFLSVTSLPSTLPAWPVGRRAGFKPRLG